MMGMERILMKPSWAAMPAGRETPLNTRAMGHTIRKKRIAAIVFWIFMKRDRRRHKKRASLWLMGSQRGDNLQLGHGAQQIKQLVWSGHRRRRHLASEGLGQASCELRAASCCSNAAAIAGDAKFSAQNQAPTAARHERRWRCQCRCRCRRWPSDILLAAKSKTAWPLFAI